MLVLEPTTEICAGGGGAATLMVAVARALDPPALDAVSDAV
jgi:hypothetical protein